MNRGVNRQQIFVDDRDRVEFLRLLGVAADRHGVEIHSYCLMSNHFHLLVRCPDGGLSDLAQWVTGQYAASANERWGRVGHLFGGRFASRLIETEAYCLNVVRYIHRNPLDIAGVDAASSYRWSSHRSYLGLRRPPRWLRTGWISSWFDGPDDFGRFVDGNSTGGIALDPAPTARALLDTVDAVLRERSTQRGAVVRSERRAIALALVERLGSPVAADVQAELGLVTASAIDSATRRASRWFDDHPSSQALVDVALGLLSIPMRPRHRAA